MYLTPVRLPAAACDVDSDGVECCEATGGLPTVAADCTTATAAGGEEALPPVDLDFGTAAGGVPDVLAAFFSAGAAAVLLGVGWPAAGDFFFPCVVTGGGSGAAPAGGTDAGGVGGAAAAGLSERWVATDGAVDATDAVEMASR